MFTAWIEGLHCSTQIFYKTQVYKPLLYNSSSHSPLLIPQFSHGQFYVACSRLGAPTRLRLAVKPEDESRVYYTRNIVYVEVLTQRPMEQLQEIEGPAFPDPPVTAVAGNNKYR